MPAPVFYSLSPYGADPVTHNLETGAGDISITSGVATLTVPQTGNIGVGVALEYNSLKCYISPNRIAFTSGGTAELLTDTKITGVTSGATGIVRFVEVTGGTWAGGDAAGWLYFESTTGTWNSSEQINRTKPTASTNIATTNGSIEGNIGNGNTQFVVKSAVGGTPSNQSSTAVTSIHHEYASLSAFEAGFTDSSHINNTDLTAADAMAHACCYYDHDNYTADLTATTINFGTADATRYLYVFTPVGGAESINMQRHSGTWDSNKYVLSASVTNSGVLVCSETHIHIDGVQVLNTHTSAGNDASVIAVVANSATVLTISSCIVKYEDTGAAMSYRAGIRSNSQTGEFNVINTIVHDVIGGTTVYTQGIESGASTTNILYCTISNCEWGIRRSGTATVVSKNSAVFNNSDDFSGTLACDYCASDDANADTYTNGVDWTAEATDWANVFDDYANDDFSLNDFTGTGTIIEQGTDLSSSEGIWRDIAGNERGSTPDIGAFEYMTAAPFGSVTSVFYGPLVGPFGGPI